MPSLTSSLELRNQVSYPQGSVLVPYSVILITGLWDVTPYTLVDRWLYQRVDEPLVSIIRGKG
jgi:hypothetical protein